MANKRTMVRFFTQICPKIIRSPSNPSTSMLHQCLVFTKEKLVPINCSKAIYKSRTFAEGAGGKNPGKEEQVDGIKMPGFVHPQAKNEEGYFTQKAHKQLEELKRKLEKPTTDNTEKKE